MIKEKPQNVFQTWTLPVHLRTTKITNISKASLNNPKFYHVT